MKGVDSEQLNGGACIDLNPVVLDKYFQASASERFQRRTAQAMCGGCAVRAACLADAIENPATNGIRGGETPESIRALHYQMKRERTAPSKLAARAIGWQRPLTGAYGEPGLRAGRFKDVPLAFPELGSELTPAHAEKETK